MAKDNRGGRRYAVGWTYGGSQNSGGIRTYVYNTPNGQVRSTQPPSQILGQNWKNQNQQAQSNVQNQQNQANAQPTPQQAQPTPPQQAQNSGPYSAAQGRTSFNFQQLTNADAQNIANIEKSVYGPSEDAARKMYISNTNFDGQGHSMSQTLNWLLGQGADIYNLNPSQYGLHLSSGDIASLQYMNDYMPRAMHDLGTDAILYRGGHVEDLSPFGITNLNNYSIGQLQNMLVGAELTTQNYLSTSYTIQNNPFLSSQSGSGVSGGREVVWNIKAPSGTRMMLGSRKQTEVIIDKGTQYRITGVRFTGQTATPRIGPMQNQIEIDVEII